MDSYARHIVSWYAGVHVDDVAAAENKPSKLIRQCRSSLNRGSEYGLAPGDALRPNLRGQSPGQLMLNECFRNETRIG